MTLSQPLNLTMICRGVALAALALPLAATAPAADAGDVRWSITVGSGGHDRAPQRSHHDRRRSGGGHGYYQSVWRPPLYQTRYDDCGRRSTVCIRPGYYDRVWVAAPPRPQYWGSHTPSRRDDGRHDRRSWRGDRSDRRDSCYRW